MCQLCTDPGPEKERLRAFARDLERLAYDYGCLANGIVNPHSESANKIGILARRIIRELVEEWV